MPGLSSDGNKGFTLLEVLVAMSIFAIIGLGASQMLRTVVTTHERTQAKIQNYSGLTRVFSVMQRDFSQVIYRPIKDGYGDLQEPFMVATGPFPVEFSRTGWNNPTHSSRSNIKRVAYGLTDDGELQRFFWLVLDRAQDSEPIVQTLLTDVVDFRVNLIEHNGDSTDVWPTGSNENPLPALAEVLLVTESLGEIRRVFAITDVAAPRVINSGGSANGGNNPTDARTGRVRVSTTNASSQKVRN